eukprot:scaffold88676_cov76-Phaeocystis_antarctica.AAC.1
MAKGKVQGTAVQRRSQFLSVSDTLGSYEGRRRARSTRASPAPIRWRVHRCARCTAAGALLQPLPSSSAPVWAVAVLA